MDCGQADAGFECGEFGAANACASDHPSQTVLGNFENGLAGEDPADSSQGRRIEAAVGFLVDLVFCHRCGAVSQASRALGIGNQFAET